PPRLALASPLWLPRRVTTRARSSSLLRRASTRARACPLSLSAPLRVPGLALSPSTRYNTCGRWSSWEVINDESELPDPRVSRRRPRCRFHPIRGRHLLHGGARLAGRRGGQDRESEDGRSRPTASPRQARRRSLVLPHVQRQQEIAGHRSQIAPRTG